ncbi:sodium:proton antiporter [Streptomyces sodiiphilus]|uniref:Sodium:proton antiporter n=1 Tax=Streptomyces sodiiphilus TaxID=226217 RepID=A0ABN2PLH5_9ACTN
MLDTLLTTVGALALVVAVFSGWIQRSPVSGPLLGLLTGIALGPVALGVLDLPSLAESHRELHDLSRILLAISVMAVALRYPFHELRTVTGPVLLLLAVAMPVMALSTTAVAALALGAGLGVAALIGTALCPTDPVLASGVASGEPAERSVSARTRRLLSLESGANDGLAMPLVLIAVAVAGTATAGGVLLESLWQILGAIALGAATGLLGGSVLRRGADRDAVTPGPVLLFSLLLALFVLGAAELLRVDGILAVFLSGIAFNATSTGEERADDNKIDEAVNGFLVLPLFVVLGAVLPWSQWAELGWRGPALVLGVLLLRRLPVLLLLRRPLALKWRDACYLGWFGPIGVSAVFYLTLEADRLDLDPVVLPAGTMVVAASTLVHALSAPPALALYRRAAERTRERTTDTTPHKPS